MNYGIGLVQLPDDVYDDANIIVAAECNEYGHLPFVVTPTTHGAPITCTAFVLVFAMHNGRPWCGGSGIQTTGSDDLGMAVAHGFGNDPGAMLCLYRGAPLAGQINDAGSGEFQVGCTLPNGGVVLSHVVRIDPPPPPA